MGAAFLLNPPVKGGTYQLSAWHFHYPEAWCTPRLEPDTLMGKQHEDQEAILLSFLSRERMQKRFN